MFWRFRLYRSLGLLTVLAGISSIVFFATGDLKVTLGYAIIGAAFVWMRHEHELAVELSEKDRWDVNQKNAPTIEMERDLLEAAQHQTDFRWWRDIAIIVLFLITAFFAIHASGWTESHSGNQVVMGSDPKELSLRLGDELQQALTDALRRLPGAGGGGVGTANLAASPRGFTWETILLAAIAAGLLGWTIRKRPSAAPIVGAAELALAAIHNADKLSRLDRGMFWFAIAVFLVTALVFLAAGLRSLKSGGEGRTDEDRDGEKKIDSPLSVGFSALILGWAVVLVAYHRANEPVAAPPVEQKAARVSLMPLTPIPLFERGSDRLDSSNAARRQLAKLSFRQLETNMASLRREGDKVLLLGSADCMEIHKNARDNSELAQRRAQRLREKLLQDHAATSEEIQVYQLPQYVRCRETQDLRAVFPFLAHADLVPQSSAKK